MRYDLRLHAGSKSADHRVEFSRVQDGTAQGQVPFRLDGEAAEAGCEETTPGVYSILLEGKSYEAHVSRQPGDAEGPYVVTVGLRHYLVEVRDPRRRRHAGSALEAEGPQEIASPMPGKIVKVLVAENQQVARGQGLLVVEAMKMQNELAAPRSGRVERIYVSEGTGVETGARLLRLV